VPVVEREDRVLEEAVPEIPESVRRVACGTREEDRRHPLQAQVSHGKRSDHSLVRFDLP
jgi:hypothetical protein